MDSLRCCGPGPLAGKTEVQVKPFGLPQVPNASPVHFAFADWDGDGKFDLLAGVEHGGGWGEDGRLPASYSIYWFGNTSAKGVPVFEAARRLLTIPAPWELKAFSVVDWDQDGRLDLVVSVSRSGKPKEAHCSQLWLYRRKG
jgi:hypothetical protein